MTLVSLSLHPVDRAREARTCARAVWYRTSPLPSLSVKRVTGARFWEASTWAQAKEEGASERERERERESKNERERERGIDYARATPSVSSSLDHCGTTAQNA